MTPEDRMNAALLALVEIAKAEGWTLEAFEGWAQEAAAGLWGP
jgi:hypothetical protein